MKPLVSVIVPVWNGAAYLDAALQSVWRQGVADLQVIVVDDGSTDDTAELMASYGTAVTPIYQPNKGPAAARNAGLQRATGEFVAFLDADDVWVDGRLTRQLHALQTQLTVDVVQGQMQYLRLIDEQWQLYDNPFFAMSLVTALFRRAVFSRVGLLDEALPYSEDVDWFFRAQSAGVRVQQLPETTLYYRRHGQNLTHRRDLIHKYTLRALSKHRRARKASR